MNSLRPNNLTVLLAGVITLGLPLSLAAQAEPQEEPQEEPQLPPIATYGPHGSPDSPEP